MDKYINTIVFNQIIKDLIKWAIWRLFLIHVVFLQQLEVLIVFCPHNVLLFSEGILLIFRVCNSVSFDFFSFRVLSRAGAETLKLRWTSFFLLQITFDPPELLFSLP